MPSWTLMHTTDLMLSLIWIAFGFANFPFSCALDSAQPFHRRLWHISWTCSREILFNRQPFSLLSKPGPFSVAINIDGLVDEFELSRRSIVEVQNLSWHLFSSLSPSFLRIWVTCAVSFLRRVRSFITQTARLLTAMTLRGPVQKNANLCKGLVRI